MSRIGNLPVKVPSGVTVTINTDTVEVKSAKGSLSQNIPSGIVVKQEGEQIVITRQSEEKAVKSKHGLVRALIDNMIEGVTTGFEKKLEVNGVGYKVNLSGRTLKLSLGYSHEVEYTAPEDIDLAVDGNNISVKGFDKQKVGQVAAKIRQLRKPEPYKGKGIMYSDEYVIRKSGKSATTGGEG